MGVESLNGLVDPGTVLRGAGKPDDRQVLAAFRERNLKVDSDPRASANQDAWGGASGAAWPARTRFEAGSPASRPAAKVDLVRSAAAERLVGPLRVVPPRVAGQLPSELVSSVRNE